jgi:hypothetical protein
VAVLTALFVVFFPLSAVGSMASLAFLIVYGTVSAGHLRVYCDTGAKPWLLVLAVVLNAALFVLLLGYTIHTGPASTWIRPGRLPRAPSARCVADHHDARASPLR